MKIRRATPGDAAAICEIYNEHVLRTVVSFETQPVEADEMAARIQEKLLQHDWLVAEHEQRLAGYAYYGPFRTRAAYDHTAESSIYLARQARGQGLGRQLYEALISSARDRRYRELIGVIALPNPASVALHQKVGFTEVGVLKNVGRKFGTYLDVGLWQLSLT